MSCQFFGAARFLSIFTVFFLSAPWHHWPLRSSLQHQATRALRICLDPSWKNIGRSTIRMKNWFWHPILVNPMMKRSASALRLRMPCYQSTFFRIFLYLYSWCPSQAPEWQHRAQNNDLSDGHNMDFTSSRKTTNRNISNENSSWNDETCCAASRMNNALIITSKKCGLAQRMSAWKDGDPCRCDHRNQQVGHLRTWGHRSVWGLVW